jgi:hypothetical protein
MSLKLLKPLPPALAVLLLLAACGAGDGGSSAPAAPTLQMQALPTEVAEGGSTVLSWSATDADTCLASGDWSGARLIAGSESLTPALGLRRYQLRCSGAGGSAEAFVEVRVTPAPVAQESAEAELARVQALEAGCCQNQETVP